MYNGVRIQLWPLKQYKMGSLSDCFSGQNEIMTPLYNTNYTPITIAKWSQNLILTIKTSSNKWHKKPKNNSTPISDFFNGQNQILR